MLDAELLNSGATYSAVPTWPVCDVFVSPCNTLALFSPAASKLFCVFVAIDLKMKISYKSPDICTYEIETRTGKTFATNLFGVARPKSPILTWSLQSMKIFTGFKSLWIMPCSCIYAKPSTTSFNSRHTLFSSWYKLSSIAFLQYIGIKKKTSSRAIFFLST